MTDRLFVDSDIVLDLLAERSPFDQWSVQLFSFADKKKIKLFVSALSFSNIHYILSHLRSKQFSRQQLSKLKTLVTVLAVDDKIIELALHSGFNDMEDAIPYYTATQNGIQLLLTRNLRDYRKAQITVMAAEDYIKTLSI